MIMLCDNCKNKSECDYYSKNIEPVLRTEQGLFANDKYLFSLYKCLDGFTCDFYEQQEEVKAD